MHCFGSIVQKLVIHGAVFVHTIVEHHSDPFSRPTIFPGVLDGQGKLMLRVQGGGGTLVHVTSKYILGPSHQIVMFIVETSRLATVANGITDLDRDSAVVTFCFCYVGSLGDYLSHLCPMSRSGSHDCAISAEICDSIGNCCKTGSLDNKHDNLMRGAQDIFAHDMDQCSSTILDPEHQLTLTIKHTGEDGWTGEWVRVMLDNGMYKHCPMYYQFLDNTSEAVL